MDLEGIMLSEISQEVEDKYCMISLLWGLLKKLNSWKQNRKWATGADGWENADMLVRWGKLTVRRWVSSGDLIHSNAIIVKKYYILQITKRLGH